MAEAEQTSNPVKLLMLALDIRKSLDKALEANPNDAEVRLDLVRFHAVTPRIAGGDLNEAREHAQALAKLDPPLGHFAAGYLAYKEKQYGPARRELQAALKSADKPTTKSLAAKWLGWLSQETQQWDSAFEIWESLRGTDPTALYEIGRTAVFCGCEVGRGRGALEEYLRLKLGKGMPMKEQAQYQLKQLK